MIRPIEPSDWPDVAALAAQPTVAAAAGYTPLDPVVIWQRKLAERGGERVHRFGVFIADQLVGYASLEAGRSRRTSHAATLELLVAPGHDPSALLRHTLGVGADWLQFSRVEVSRPAGDPSLEALAAHGFAIEVVRREARWLDGRHVDEVLVARLEPSFQPPEPQRPAPSWPPPGRRTGSAIRIRASGVEDAAAYAELMAEPTNVWGTLQVPSVTAASWRERLQSNDDIGRHGMVAEVDTDRGPRVIGNIGVFVDVHPRRHVGHIGMAVASEWQGMGVGRQMMRAATDLADDWLGLHRLDLEVYPDNVRAKRLYQQFGFVAEGVRRAAVMRNGEFVDSLVMGRLRSTVAL